MIKFVTRGDNRSRKGELKYAEELFGLIQAKHTDGIMRIAVVGDGEGDVKFAKNLQDIAGTTRSPIEVVGFFILHSELVGYQSDSLDFHFFRDWNELCETFVQENIRSSFSAALVDVDRTAILPRNLADEEFLRIREQAIFAYVSSFHKLPLSADQTKIIMRKIGIVSENLREYNEAGENRLFKNEEIVAFAALMSSIGCLNEGWLLEKYPVIDLFSLIDWISKNVSDRSWVCGLNGDEQNGANHWHVDPLCQHISDVKVAYHDGNPVICHSYRLFENAVLNQTQGNGVQFYNSQLLAALKHCPKNSVVFLSDRPGISLGISTGHSKTNLLDLPLIAGLLE